MRKLVSVNKSVSEDLVLENVKVFFEEVASNLYFVKKHRLDSLTKKYVDSGFVAKELNSGFDVGIKKMDGELLTNLSRKPYRSFLVETLNREVI